MSALDVTDLYREFGTDRLPPGQRKTSKFPVLSKGSTPEYDPETWRFSVTGAVEKELEFSLSEFKSLPAATQRQDFHCVTGWSKFDCEFHGVPFPELAERAGVHDEAEHILFHGLDGYTTDLPLAECLRDEVLFTWEFDGEPLAPEHGAPLRVVTPHKYAYKGAKWCDGIEFLTEPQLGYWEKRGYSETANPWNEERYS